MRRSVTGVLVGVLPVLVLGGCAAQRRDPNCKWVMPVLGAAAGATGGGLGVSEGEPTPSDGEIAAGAAGGAVVGGLIGWALGHWICQEPEPPPPPPPPPAPPARGTKIAELAGPHFDFDKATLTPEGRRRVEDAARILKQHPDVRLSVQGYTDSVGSDAYNMRLSERRAQTVADHLVDAGIPSSRMKVRGFGKSNPIADNSTEAGRAKNRRVEIIVD